MNLTFVNGNAIQQAACRTVAHNLLNLPFDAIFLTHKVEFTADPLPSSHSEFAVTDWTYGDTEPFTKIASVAPAWPEPWRGVKFLQEVYAHELGHGLFASLPEEARIAIAAMFGADSDDIEELQPDGSDWEDRIMEGIAETFKDAFLPRRFRRYPNRTNRHIPISKYPEFRSLWRGGIEQVGGAGINVPAYSLDVYRQYKVPALTQVYKPEPLNELFFGGTFFTGNNNGGLYQQIEGWEPPLEHVDNTLYKQYKAAAATEVLMVPHGTHFEGSIVLPQDIAFFGPSTDHGPGAFGAHQGEAGYAGTFTWEQIHNNPELEDPFGQFEYPFGDRMLGIVAADIWFTYWKPSTATWVCWDYRSGSIIGFEPQYKFGNPHPSFPGTTFEHTGCWIIMKGDGRNFGVINEGDQWSIPIGTISLGSNVPSIAPTISTCGGDLVQVRIFSKVTLKTAVSNQDSLATIQSRLPSFTIDRKARPCKGSEIILPEGSLIPGGARRGEHPSGRPVCGHC